MLSGAAGSGDIGYRLGRLAGRIASEIAANSATLVGDANAVNETATHRKRLETIAYDASKLRADCDAAASPGTAQSGVTLKDLGTLFRLVETIIAQDRGDLDRPFPGHPNP